MNFFEMQLKKIMGQSTILKDQKYIGRICYGQLNNELRARVEFVTLGITDHYAGIKASIINKKEGTVDSALIRFSDIWGKQNVSNPYFKEGVMPHIWTNNGVSSWYAFYPSEEHYQQLFKEIEDYMSVFSDMEMEQAKQEGGMNPMCL